MKINITYPNPKERKLQRGDIINLIKWPISCVCYLCVVINICTGGKPWCIVVLWSLFILWSLVVSPAKIEYNRISQFIKFITQVCILLVLIQMLLAPSLWAEGIVPIVCFSGLIIVGILFFTDLERQKHNVLPMLLLSAVVFIGSIIGLFVLKGSWALIVTTTISFTLLAGCIVVFNSGTIQELKKLFHTK